MKKENFKRLVEIAEELVEIAKDEKIKPKHSLNVSGCADGYMSIYGGDESFSRLNKKEKWISWSLNRDAKIVEVE